MVCHFPIWFLGSRVVFDCINSSFDPSLLLLRPLIVLHLLQICLCCVMRYSMLSLSDNNHAKDIEVFNLKMSRCLVLY